MVAFLVFSFIPFSATNSQTVGTTTTHSMGDDGYVNVPLPFAFPFYGQQFNNSWMYDNGVVSFLQPNTQGALSPWQWYSTPLTSGNIPGSYFIAPLWTDVAPVGNTVYSTNSDGTFMKYTWNNISEYYSGGTRLNTFSLTIRPDGTFNTTYTNLNLNSSNITAGYVGDPAKNEFTQIQHFGGGSVVTTGGIADWSGSTGSVIDSCSKTTVYSLSCSNPVDTILKSITGTDPVTTPIVEATTTGVIADPVGVAPIQSTTTSVGIQPVQSVLPTSLLQSTAPTTTTTTTATSVSSASRPGAPLSLVLGVIRNEQSRIASLESSVVLQANESATRAANEVKTVSEAVASLSATASNNTNTSGVGIQTNTIGTQSTTTLGIALPTSNNGAQNVATLSTTVPMFDNSSLNVPGQQIALSRPQIATESESVGTNFNIEIATNTGLNLTGKNPISEYLEQKPILNDNQPTNTFNTNLNRATPDNELANGISIETLARTPVGFAAYSFVIPDATLYPEKEIYRNQKPVDNVKIQRALTGASDLLHQRMVDQQYNRESP